MHSALAWYLDLPHNTWSSMYEVELPRAPPAALLGGEASSWGEHCDATNLQQVTPTPTLTITLTPTLTITLTLTLARTQARCYCWATR